MKNLPFSCVVSSLTHDIRRKEAAVSLRRLVRCKQFEAHFTLLKKKQNGIADNVCETFPFTPSLISNLKRR